jgi:hypothetical protein
MNKKYTPWFSAAIEPPTRRGEYQVRNLAKQWAFGQGARRYWTGSRWLVRKGGMPSNFGHGLTTGPADEWRGLLTRAGGAK